MVKPPAESGQCGRQEARRASRADIG